MKKRVLSLLLVLSLMLCSLSVTAAAADKVYGTVPIYIGYADVDYMADQLLKQIAPTGKTDRERILSVYNWIIQNCDREGAADKKYFDEAQVYQNSGRGSAFAKAMDAGLNDGSIVLRMDIASSLQQNSFLVPYDSNYYIASFAYEMMLYRVGNCAHYAALLDLLLGHLGYDCRLIDGQFVNSDGSTAEHKWNMVLLEGKYYWLDPRMDHANFVRTGTLDHSYFLIEDKAAWQKKHLWNDDYSDALMENAADMVEGYGLLAAIPGQVEENFETMTPWSICSQWAEPFLLQAAEKGIYPDVLLQTDMTRPITRAEFAAVVVQYYTALSGLSPTPAQDAENPFSDVTADQTAILIAYQLGVVGGYPDGTFKPQGSLTRAEAATMLGRVAELVQTGAATRTGEGLEVSDVEMTFKDNAEIQDWCANYIKYFVRNGAIGGRDDGRFDPSASMKREEAMKIAVAALGE